jgi:hypothetical protein
MLSWWFARSRVCFNPCFGGWGGVVQASTPPAVAPHYLEIPDTGAPVKGLVG